MSNNKCHVCPNYQQNPYTGYFECSFSGCEVEIRADERDKICKEQLEIMSTDGIYGHDGVVTISQEAFENIQRELCENERKKFAEWCKTKGYSCYDWRMLIEQYEQEQKGE